jgi:hypothetical protein
MGCRQPDSRMTGETPFSRRLYAAIRRRDNQVPLDDAERKHHRCRSALPSRALVRLAGNARFTHQELVEAIRRRDPKTPNLVTNISTSAQLLKGFGLDCDQRDGDGSCESPRRRREPRVLCNRRA